MTYPVTSHTIVKNEERAIWYSLHAVAPFVQEMLITDTGSQDNTVAIIQAFINTHPEKIITFNQTNITHPSQINQLRQQQIEQTKTPWFLLLDGDEIWPQAQLKKLLEAIKATKFDTLAIVNHTRNCAGDIYHYLPQSFGHYQLLGHTGHFNIRLMKTLNYEVKNTYPEEGYYFQGKLINSQDRWLTMSDAWYLHLSHLNRTSSTKTIYGRRKIIYANGIKLTQIPEVINAPRPSLVPDITGNRSFAYHLIAILADIVRKIIK